MIEQVGLRLLGGPVTIAEVLPGSAGERAGLRRGDQIVRFAGQPADQASDLIRWIRAMPEQNASIDILRDGRPMTLPVRLGADADPANPGGPKLGKLGAQLSQHVETELIRDEPVHALGHAMREVWRTSMLSLKVLGKMIVGQASLQNLSGPITVADFAGKAASLGWQSFIAFLALISVSLGVLNLLPVPVLDGGICCIIAWNFDRQACAGILASGTSKDRHRLHPASHFARLVQRLEPAVPGSRLGCRRVEPSLPQACGNPGF